MWSRHRRSLARPALIQFGFSDQVGAMAFLSDILAALYARERTGRGQKIETSQLGATNHFQGTSNTGAWRYGGQGDAGCAVCVCGGGCSVGVS